MKRYVVATGLILTLFLSGARAVYADTLGQIQTFRVNVLYDASGANTLSATLRNVSQHAYFYVDDRYWSSLPFDQQQRYAANLTTLANEFDAVIYPRSTEFWGKEANAGVDGDAHVVILLERLVGGSGGYFETIHNYSQERASASNAREMIFVSAESALTGNAKTFLVHEFQHLISFNQKELLRDVMDDVWLNEARSEYAITLAGYSEPFGGSTLQRRMDTFAQSPSDSLVEWPNTSNDYAVASLFAHYIVDHYGADVIANSMHNDMAGVSAVESALRQGGEARSFGDVFVDWMVASYLNDRTTNSKYGYIRSGLQALHVPPTLQATIDVSTRANFTYSVREWQPLWFKAIMTNTTASHPDARIRIQGASDVAWRGAVIGTYQNSQISIVPFVSVGGIADVPIPAQRSGVPLTSVAVAISYGSMQPVGTRSVDVRAVSVSVGIGDASLVSTNIAQSPTPTPNVPAPQYVQLSDGDLIRRAGQDEVYVVWGAYRRYLPRGVLELYGFESRPVIEVPDDIFARYTTSNYVRAQSQKKVYAVWPDGTKHWMNITATQWDASGRDWGAIFTVNDAEVSWYATGADILR
mgnify:FL=1